MAAARKAPGRWPIRQEPIYTRESICHFFDNLRQPAANQREQRCRMCPEYETVPDGAAGNQVARARSRRFLDELRDAADTIFHRISGDDVTELDIDVIGFDADQREAVAIAGDECRSRTHGVSEQYLIVHVVIGGQKHDACEWIALEDTQQPEQYAIGGPAVARLDDHIPRRQRREHMLPVALVLPRDDRANPLTRRDAPRALQRLLQERGTPALRAERLRHCIAALVGR